MYIYININVYIPINYTQLAIAAKARWKMVDIPFPPCDRRRQSKGSSEGQEKLDQAKIDDTLGTLWDMLGIWSGSDFVFFTWTIMIWLDDLICQFHHLFIAFSSKMF